MTPEKIMPRQFILQDGEEKVRIERDIELKDFSDFLVQYGINLENFGVNQAKPLEDLYLEVIKGESILSRRLEDGKLIRNVQTTRVYIYYEEDGEILWLLREGKQTFGDGR